MFSFFFFTRDPEIWRQACLKVWGRTCNKLVPYTSWREMFLERPRVRFDGKAIINQEKQHLKQLQQHFLSYLNISQCNMLTGRLLIWEVFEC